MIEFEKLMEGVKLLYDYQVALSLLAGMFLGILGGAVPGISASMAVGVFLPITFRLEPLIGISFLCAVYAGACYGGSITAILINTPGTPSATCTVLDGYPMTLKGEANRALGLSLGASCFGGVFSYIIMLFFTYPVASFAIKFGPAEIFLLAIMGLTIIGSMRENSFSKSMLVGLAGIMVATMGIAPDGKLRAYFGFSHLMDGMPQIPAIMGCFAFAEMFNLIHQKHVANNASVNKDIKEITVSTFEIFKYWGNIIRSSLLGTYIGAIPAAGSTIASVISYNQAKVVSKNPDSFGTGNPEGVIAAETANNASSGGALITMFALGIPGGATTAIMLGALTMQGLQPGPRLFMTQMEMVYAVIVFLLISQLVMYIMGIGFSYSLSGLLNISTSVLVPLITVTCIVGCIAVRNSIFDAYLLLIFGIIGILMKKHGYPPIAFILGVMLGSTVDSEFIRMVVLYKGDLTILFRRPISLVMMIIIIVVTFYQPIKNVVIKNKSQSLD